jgi:hypothetical protein
LRAAGLDLSGIAIATIPVAAGWFILALLLGRAQERRAAGDALRPSDSGAQTP